MNSQQAAFYETQLQTHVEGLPAGHSKRHDFVSYLKGTGPSLSTPLSLGSKSIWSGMSLTIAAWFQSPLPIWGARPS